MELWRVHPVYTDYEISDAGRVRRCTAKGGTRVGRMKSQRPNDGGYLTVMLGKKCVRVHVLVLEAFVGPRPAKHDACHYDGTRTNNALSNLRWATRSENMSDARRHGTAQSNAEKIRAYWRDFENRAAQAERVRNFIKQHPERFAAGNEARKAGLANPTVRERMRQAKLGKKQSPELIAKRMVGRAKHV